MVVCRQTNPQILSAIPALEFPGPEFPRRQGFHPPLLPVIRRPMTEARGFLDRGRCGGAHDAAANLPRRLADHIDKFRLLAHHPLLASDQSGANTLTTCFDNASNLRSPVPAADS